MAEKTYQTTLLIRGDSKDAVRSVQLTRDELAKLTGAQEKSVAMTARMGAAFKNADSYVKNHNAEIKLLGAAVVGGMGFALKAVIDYSDKYKNLQGQLRLVTDSQEELNKVYTRALSLSNATGASLDSTVNLYARMSRATEELNLSQDQLFKITQAINQSYIVSGSSAQEAASSTLQLSQGLAAGALRGEELNSVMENSPRLARALADGLGVSIGQLRAMGKEGELTAEKVTDALLKMSGSIDTEFQKMPMTVARATNEVKNQLADAFGKADLTPLVESITELGTALKDPAVIEGLTSMASALVDIANASAQATAGIAGFAKGVGEYLASFSGAASDDMPRLAARIEELRVATDKFGRAGLRSTSRSEVKAQIEELKQLEAIYALNLELLNNSTKKKAAESKATESLTKRTADWRVRIEAANDSIVETNRELSKLVAKQEEEAKNAPKAVSAVKAISDARKIANLELRHAQIVIQNVNTELDAMAAAAKENAKAQADAAKETTAFWEDVRTTMFGMFFEMAADGQNAFDVLVNGFKGMIAKMLAEAAANTILLAVGVGATGSAAAGTAGAAGGAGGIGNLVSAASTGYSWLKGGGIGGAVQGGFNALATGYEGVAQFASQQGWHGVAGAAQTSAGQYAGGLGASAVNLGLNVGAGMLGSYAGQQVFQNKGSTGIGSAGGAIVGSIWGPIGTAVGAFVGEGIEKAFASAFGYSGQKKNRASIGFDTATDYAAPLGGKHDKDNLRNANDLYGVINEMADLLGGNLSGTIRVSNRDGVEISGLGRFKSSADAFNAVLKELIKSSDTIAESMKPLILGFKGTAEEVSRFAIAVSSIDSMAGINTVTNAIKDFAVTLPNATESYKLHTDALQEQIRAFDGSLSAAESLNAVLYENKTAAYNFALSIQSIGRSISDSALGQAQSIRESVLTPQQLLDRRYDQRDSLAASLLTEKDPERAAATAQRLLEVNQQIFNSITDDQQLLYYENFAKVAENTNNVAQYILDQSLKGLQTTQDAINKQVADMWQVITDKNQRAADTQLQAANVMLEASYRWIKGNQVAV